MSNHRRDSIPFMQEGHEQSRSVRVEKISNGFLAHHHAATMSKGKYHSTNKTVYHSKHPGLKLQVDSMSKKYGKKGMDDEC